MGTKNKERRAASRRRKAEQRRRRPQAPHPRYPDHGPGGEGSSGRPRDATPGSDTWAEEPFDGLVFAEGVVAEAVTAVTERPDVAEGLAEAMTGDVPWSPHDLDRAWDAVLLRLVDQLWAGGWQPADLHAVAVRRLPAAQPLVDLLAADTARRSRAGLDRRWWQQLVELGADVPPERGRPVAATTRVRTGGSARDANAALLGLAAVLLGLPRMEVLLPRPGDPAVRPADRAEPADEAQARALSRVRALLSKAESTEFPEEAEALSAKAQDLMARHSLDALLAQPADGAGGADVEQGRRLWLDAPYVNAKALLVDAVARANRCRSVQFSGLDCVTVVGAEHDVAAVELLVTSLQVQATRALLDRGRSAGSRARSRGYRQSFLVAYADRVGQRLEEATATAEQDAAVTAGRDLRPVLVDQAARVEEATQRLFPHLRQRSINVSDFAGYAAGKVAADQARLAGPEALAG